MFLSKFLMIDAPASSATPATPAAPTSAAPAVGGSNAQAPSSTREQRSSMFKSIAEDFGKQEEDNAFSDYDFSEYEDGSVDPVTGGESGIAEGTPQTAAEPTFSPYSFKGSVLGKETEQTFSTQEELDTCIQRGIAAPQIYKNLEDLKKTSAAWKQDAEHVDGLYKLASEDPAGFLDMMFDELIDEAKGADWVYEKFQKYAAEFKKTPAQRDADKKLAAANRIIEEQRRYGEMQRTMQEQAMEQAMAQDRKFVTNWREQTINNMKKDIPAQFHKHAEAQLGLVMKEAKLMVDANPELSVSKACAMAEKKLKMLLEPYKGFKSPDAARKELGDAMTQKSQQATSKLQGIASGKQTETTKAPEKKLTRADVHKEVLYRLSKGVPLKV